MKSSKRILAMLLAVLLLFSVMPLTALAASDDPDDTGFPTEETDGDMQTPTEDPEGLEDPVIDEFKSRLR